MDEIDAVGRHRGAGLGGGHDEREQTLNQLLVEMDGFELKDNIILIAATNRPDILDPALLRPGRFDRQIVVDRPDRNGRRKILEVHTKGKPIAPEIDLDTLAAGTPGFTGADLANLVNEAALLAARRGKKMIEQEELEEGIMRVIAGPEKKTRLLSEQERKITAYHEMGHALVGHYLEHTDDGPQDLGHQPRPGARLHDLAAARGPLPDDEVRAHGQARDDARRPCRGGARLPRDHDRRGERPREGDAHGEADDHALRHEREARPARARPQPRHAVPRARHGRRARLLRRDRARDRRRDPPHDRGGARGGAPRSCASTWTSCTGSRRSSSSARRSTRTSSSGCSPARPRSRCSPRRPPPAPEPAVADEERKRVPKPKPPARALPRRDDAAAAPQGRGLLAD